MAHNKVLVFEYSGSHIVIKADKICNSGHFKKSYTFTHSYSLFKFSKDNFKVLKQCLEFHKVGCTYEDMTKLKQMTYLFSFWIKLSLRNSKLREIYKKLKLVYDSPPKQRRRVVSKKIGKGKKKRESRPPQRIPRPSLSQFSILYSPSAQTEEKFVHTN